MSNQQVGAVYSQIIADVIESSRVDFEEGGVDDHVLEELKLVCCCIALLPSLAFIFVHQRFGVLIYCRKTSCCLPFIIPLRGRGAGGFLLLRDLSAAWSDCCRARSIVGGRPYIPSLRFGKLWLHASTIPDSHSSRVTTLSLGCFDATSFGCTCFPVLGRGFLDSRYT